MRAARNVTPLLAILALALIGCAAPGPIFPAVEPPLVWPPPPDTGRIAYIGELTGEASLQKPPTALEALGEILTGPRAKAAFITPMAVDVAGERVFVADPGGGAAAVHILDLDTRDYRAVRSAGGAPLCWPIDIAVCGERVAVADAQRGAVLFFSRDGDFLSELRDGLMRPVGLAWSSRTQTLYILDAAAPAVLAVDAGGRALRRFGTRGVERGEFNAPAGISLFERDGFELLAIADAMNFRVQILDVDGRPMLRFGKKGDAAGDFSLPRDVAVDSSGQIYVLDNQFENFQVFDAAGTLLTAVGREGADRGEFALPSCITIDAQDRIWVADTYNRRVQVFQYLGGQTPPLGEEPSP